jgi:hypothetical protein
MRARIAHLWRISRLVWFITFEILWFLFTNLDFVITKYGSTHWKQSWDKWTHPHFSWTAWAAGALAIAIPFLIEGSFQESEAARRASDAKIADLDGKIQRMGGPRVLLRYSDKGRIGIAPILNNMIYENLGNRSALNVRIIPDKTKEFWLEQVGFVDVVVPGTTCQFNVIAMMRSQGREERVLDSDHDPLRILASTMVVSGSQQEIRVTVGYHDFDDSKLLTDEYVFRLDNLRQPHFVMIPKS